MTNIKAKTIEGGGIRIAATIGEKEVGHAYLYILKNDQHELPFAFMEDVFVEEDFRSQGIGTQILVKIIEAAQDNQCYKIVGTSRHERINAHKLYERLGFQNYGLEFRINL